MTTRTDHTGPSPLDVAAVKAQRHARQGSDAARRAYADIITGKDSGAAALDRVAKGPGPVAFKDAFAETLTAHLAADTAAAPADSAA